MGLGAIGDIGSVSFGVVDTISWDTAADWDAAVSETNVVHDNVGDRTETEVVVGVPPDGTAGGAYAVYLLDEDSGTTAADSSGNGRDATYNGATLGGAGTYNSSDASLDGADDYVGISTGNFASYGSQTGAFTIVMRVQTTTTATAERFLGIINNSGENGIAIDTNRDRNFNSASGRTVFFVRDSGNDDFTTDISADLYDGNYHTIVWRVIDTSSNSSEVYVDGVSVTNTVGRSQNPSGFNNWEHEFTLGAVNNRGSIQDYLDGDIDSYEFYTTDIGATAAADAHLDSGSLTTATKSLSSPSQPDLQNLDYDLNGETLDIDVIGSPGTGSEETVNSGSLDGVQTGATLSWSSSHTDFRVRPNFTISDITNSPVVRGIELQ